MTRLGFMAGHRADGAFAGMRAVQLLIRNNMWVRALIVGIILIGLGVVAARAV